jgi:homogentisate 1,2-dioxygenase
MVTLHPSGFPHGPHPKALGNAFAPRTGETDEVAVMIDTRDAVDVAPLPEGVEDAGYVESWRGAP